MMLFALAVVAGVALYVMRPDERKRLVSTVFRGLGGAVRAVRNSRSTRDAFEESLEARTRRPLVTAAIVLLNAALFVAMHLGAASGDADAIVRWGGSVGPVTTNGAWWRLATAAFVHAGVLSVLLETAGLWQAGVIVERMLGHATFAVVYIGSAALAHAIHLSADPMTPAAGAAGAVLGVYGVLMAIGLRGLLERSPLRIPLRVLKDLAPASGIFLLYWLATAGPDRFAGFMALGTGFVLGVVLTRDAAEHKPQGRRIAAVATAALIMVAAIAIPLHGIVDVRPEIGRLVALEERTAAEYGAATEQFKLGAIKADALAQIIDRRILPEIQAAVGRLEALHGVTRAQQPLVAAAAQYLDLRRESWEIRARALHKSSMRLLRDADQKELASLDAFDKIKPAAVPGA
jgi:membrane associated rhomboid family serine protease